MSVLGLLLTLPVLALGQKGCVPSETVVNGKKNSCKGDIIFQDTFDSLNFNKWQRVIRISGDEYDFAVFDKDPANSYTTSGKLLIKPTPYPDSFVKSGTLKLEGCTEQDVKYCSMKASSYSIIPPVKTAQLCTKDSFSFKYGKISVRAKLPSGDWVQPQIIMKPKDNHYGERFKSGKIRLASSRGNLKLVTNTGRDIGSKSLSSGILVAYDDADSPIRARTALFESSEPWSSDFHEYTFEWAPDSLRFYVDGKVDKARDLVESRFDSLIESVGFSIQQNPLWSLGSPIAPFDREFYICLGVTAGGGHGFPDGSVSNGIVKPWINLRTKSLLNFWLARSQWLSTWSEDTKLEVDSIIVTAL